MIKKIKENMMTWFFMFFIIPVTLCLFNMQVLNEAQAIKNSHNYISYHGKIVGKQKVADLHILSIHFDNGKDLDVNVNKPSFYGNRIDDNITVQLQPVVFMNNGTVEGQNFSMVIIILLILFDA